MFRLPPGTAPVSSGQCSTWVAGESFVARVSQTLYPDTVGKHLARAIGGPAAKKLGIQLVQVSNDGRAMVSHADGGHCNDRGFLFCAVHRDESRLLQPAPPATRTPSGIAGSPSATGGQRSESSGFDTPERVSPAGEFQRGNDQRPLFLEIWSKCVAQRRGRHRDALHHGGSTRVG